MGMTNEEPSIQIKHRLMRSIYNLVASSPTCVLIPEESQLCQEVLKELAANSQKVVVENQVRSILDRNRRLTTRLGGVDNTVSDNEITLGIFLDNLSLPCDIVEASSACVRISKTVQAGVAELLRWASNVYNVGQYRKYVALSILTSLAEDGLDLTECVLGLLPHLDTEYQVDCRTISRIVAELARKSIFNAASALRWFIVNGLISGAAANEKVC